jgi:23S rRNA-/tRNA-specific pseudouridylate synthase
MVDWLVDWMVGGLGAQIDFATEGVLLAAVTQTAAAEVCKNFEKHRNKKQYLVCALTYS